MDQLKRVKLEDDTKESVSLLVERRVPWLFAGLLGGIALTFISSRFEYLLSQNISLAFFIPIIVYMSDAVGTQSQTIYIRNIGKKSLSFPIYLIKELLTGTTLGLIFGIIIGFSSLFWLNSTDIALSVGLAMFVNMATAPVIALLIARILQTEKADPALGGGPFSTILEDLISLSIYFVIASLIIFR